MGQKGGGGRIERGRESGNIPNTDHDQDAAHGDRAVMGDLPPALHGIKVSIFPRLGHSNGEVQDGHAEHRDHEAEDALPPNDLQRLQSVVIQYPFLQHELCRGEYLRSGNEEDADNRPHGLGCPGLREERWCGFVVFEQRAGQAHNPHSHHDEN